MSDKCLSSISRETTKVKYYFVTSNVTSLFMSSFIMPWYIVFLLFEHKKKYNKISYCVIERYNFLTYFRALRNALCCSSTYLGKKNCEGRHCNLYKLNENEIAIHIWFFHFRVNKKQFVYWKPRKVKIEEGLSDFRIY